MLQRLQRRVLVVAVFDARDRVRTNAVAGLLDRRSGMGTVLAAGIVVVGTGKSS